VIGPAPEPKAGEARTRADETADALRDAGLEGRTLRDALQALGVPRNEAYRLALEPPGDR